MKSILKDPEFFRSLQTQNIGFDESKLLPFSFDYTVLGITQ